MWAAFTAEKQTNIQAYIHTYKHTHTHTHTHTHKKLDARPLAAYSQLWACTWLKNEVFFIISQVCLGDFLNAYLKCGLS